MAVKINLENKSLIPVEFGELSFSVDVSDRGKEHLISLVDKYSKETDGVDLEVTDQESYMKAVEVMKSVLEKVYDDLFGVGSFKKIYDKYPDVILLSGSFVEVCEGVITEYDKRTGKEKMDKYLNQKQRKSK